MQHARSNSLHEPDLGALASRRRSQVHGSDAGPMSEVEAAHEPSNVPPGFGLR